MASRDFLKHTVSTTEPTDSTLGDEWYNPTTNKIFKRLAVNGTTVAFREIPAALTVQASGVTVAQGASIINFNGYTLTVDSTGAVNVAVPSAAAGGSNTHVQYNNAGALAGSANFTWTNATNTLSATNISSSGSITVGTGNAIDPSSVGGFAAGQITESSTGFSAPGIVIGSSTGQHGAIVYGSGTMYFGTEVASTDNTMNTRMTLTSAGLFLNNLTSGRVTFATTSGQLTDSANLTWNGSTLGVTGTVNPFILSRTGNVNVATTWTTTSPIFNSGAALVTDQSATTGTIALKVGHSLLSPNFAASNAQTITNAANLYVNGNVASTNTTITNNWAIYNEGNMRVTGTLYNDAQITAAGIILRSGNFSRNTFTLGGALELSAATITDTTGTGTIATKGHLGIGQATFASSSATTVTNAANLYIAGDAVAGTNTTLTNTWGIYNAGKTNSLELHTPTGYTNRPDTGHDVTGNRFHAQTSINIGRASGGDLTFGQGNFPTVIAGTPTTLRAYLNNNTSNQVFYATTTGMAVGDATTPQYQLDVNNGVTAANSFQASFGSTYSAGFWSGIHFGYSEAANTSYRKSAIVFERQDSSARGKVHILNNGTASAATATLSDARLTITFDGNVGVGQTNPVAKFEVSGASGQLFAVTDSMTGTIFSANDSSGIPSIEVLDTGLVKLAEYGGFVTYGVNNAVSAAGTTQATATLLTRPINNVTTVAANSGVILPSAYPGMRVMVRNATVTTLRVYPGTGAQINTLGTNVQLNLETLANIEFVAFTTTQWYTVNATFA